MYPFLRTRTRLWNLDDEAIKMIRRSGYRLIPNRSTRKSLNWGRALTREAALLAGDSKRRAPRHLLHLTWGVGYFKYRAWPRIRRRSFVWISDRDGNVVVKLDPGSREELRYLKLSSHDFPAFPWDSWEWEDQVCKLIENWLLANI